MLIKTVINSISLAEILKHHIQILIDYKSSFEFQFTNFPFHSYTDLFSVPADCSEVDKTQC